MNARQKAKKYKKLAELNRIKAEAHDRLLKSEAFKRYLSRKNGTIETIKIVKLWRDDKFPIDFIKNDISKEFGQFCLDNGLIYLKVDDDYDEFTMCRKVTGTMKICKDWWEVNADADTN